MRRQLCTCIAVAMAACLAAPASANVIYSDTFTRVTGSGDANGDPNGAADNFSDWGTNDNGLGGTQSQAWVSGPSRAGGGRNAVTNGTQGVAFGTASFYDFDVTTVAPNGFEVAFDFSRFVDAPDPGPGGGGFISFALGIDAGTAITSEFAPTNLSDFSLLFQQAANGNAANANVGVDGATIDSFDYLTPDAPHSLILTAIPAVSGAYGAADTVNIEVVVDGSITQNYALLGGDNFGSFAVGANNFDARFIDNLVVSAVPEPASIGLLGLAALGFVARRR